MTTPITKPFDAATRAELVLFAQQKLGLDTEPRWSTDTLRNRIRQVFHGDEITIWADDPEPEAEAVAAPSPAIATAASVAGLPDPFGGRISDLTGRADPVVVLTIPEQEGEAGKAHVPVWVNGVSIALPRNTRFPCPYRYYEALKNAERHIYTYDESTGERTSENVIPEYPVMVNEWPPQDAIDRWREAQNTPPKGSRVLAQQPAAEW